MTGVNYNETIATSDIDGDGIFETSARPSQTNTQACILGMANIYVLKDTANPGQCRVDSRIGTDYPGTTVSM